MTDLQFIFLAPIIVIVLGTIHLIYRDWIDPYFQKRDGETE
jgi:hypothetical protein